MTEQKTEKRSEIKPLTEEQQQERAEQIELIITMFPKLSKDRAQSVIRFAAMMCDLCSILKIDPLEYMVKTITQYREADRRIEAGAAASEDEDRPIEGTGDYYCNDCDFSCMDQAGMEPFPCPECESGTMIEASAAASDDNDRPLKGTGNYYCNECGYGYIDDPELETGMCPECDCGEIYEETESNE